MPAHWTPQLNVADEQLLSSMQSLQSLTPREREVAHAIAQGKPNAVIAAELYMSVATVKAHTSRLLTKLGLGNRTQIALLVHDAGAV